MRMKLDNLCRVVIPKAMRQEIGIVAGSEVDMTARDGAITVRPVKCTCRLCGEPVTAIRAIPLCDRCIDTVKRIEV